MRVEPFAVLFWALTQTAEGDPARRPGIPHPRYSMAEEVLAPKNIYLYLYISVPGTFAPRKQEQELQRP